MNFRTTYLWMEDLKMKAFDQNSIGLTNFLVHRTIFKRKKTKNVKKYNQTGFIQSKQEWMNEF